ncbi:efflux RND transporter periplasmic adaptor subunit [Aestuariicoccus sp. MJ-SS9]|uniref:efflux RND transporter periplasmic adaptor subunit n=1 Tax=Aestuariicoccus sp. MJ-SS9 TaxID=3079855 RepID=UPI0029072997|nr:efflux RND transporter periplasmic adaptor subunit [Aestuariicoccus sp. MJ-SS9]MDU8913766.1 efflux RND transporter periplasmic adaptor subunit [Aestuariicoccus sp. MJ-SS9]
MQVSFVASLALLFLLSFASAAPAQGRPASVAVDTVATMEMSETTAVFGEVVSGRQSRVAARVAGIADTVIPRVGDRFSEGDVLARMDSELFEIGLAQARADVGVAEAGIGAVDARVERTEKAFRRAESLRANSTIAEAQLEDRAGDYAEALAARREAVARVEAARTALRRAEYEFENATVRAPFDGVVVDVTTQVGQFVAAGSEIATLVDIGAMEVEANVPARFVDALGKDLSVEAFTDAGGALTLRLRAVLPTEFSATRTRPVRFELIGAAETAAIGQSVTLNLPISAPRMVTAVPKDALIQARGGWQVFVAVDGKAEPRSVEIGAALGDRFEVLSGLAPGDRVVVRGNERLRPGQDIAPTPVAPVAGEGPGGDGAASGAPAQDEGAVGETGEPRRQAAAAPRD